MKNGLPTKLERSRQALRGLAIGMAALGASAAALADTGPLAPRDGTIGYVLTDLYWSMYQTQNAKQECPKGFNDGPREQYEKLYPNNGKGKTILETQLKLEAETWLPTTEPDGFVFHEVQGPHSFGLNLDGKVGPEDFTHPETGEKGIDNQVYRAVGCIIGFRGPDGVEYIFQNKAIASDRYNRLMIELTGVDSLANDDDVEVTIYRGTDRLLTDASGNKVVPGGSQRIDTRWGAKLIQQTRGKIVDGVLTTEPLAEVIIPWQNLSVPTYQRILDTRFQLKLSPTGAEGLIAGYADIDIWYKQLIRNDSTHHLSNGQISGISLYKALRRLADAYPDETGANRAASTSLDAKFTQVFIQHPQGEAAKADMLRALREKSSKEGAAGNVVARQQ